MEGQWGDEKEEEEKGGGLSLRDEHVNVQLTTLASAQETHRRRLNADVALDPNEAVAMVARIETSERRRQQSHNFCITLIRTR